MKNKIMVIITGFGFISTVTAFFVTHDTAWLVLLLAVTAYNILVVLADIEEHLRRK